MININLVLRQWGCCCNPSKIFFKPLFLPNNLRQTLQCNHFHILYASFDVYEVKLGGVVLVWGSSKRIVEGVIKENSRGGLVKSHDCYFVRFFQYLTRYALQTCYVDENHHFLTLFSQKSCENTMFLRFFSEKLNFC